MHPHQHPEATGVARRIRPRSSRRGLGLIVATALVGATLVAVAAPSASANSGGSVHDITACTFDGKPHLEVFVGKDDDTKTVNLALERDAGDDYFYYWVSGDFDSYWLMYESWIGFSSGVNYLYNRSGSGENEISWNEEDAGSILVVELSRILNYDYDADWSAGDGPLGDPLCSLTIVFANLDGSDPRPAPPATPVSAPTTAVSCSPLPAQAGATVTCTVTGGDPGISILWRASYNPVFAEAGVTLGADGTGSFSFVVPAAALGQEVMVELVEWMAPISIGMAEGGSLVPTRVPAGEGRGVPAGALVVLAGVTLFAAVAVRRQAAGRVG